MLKSSRINLAASHERFKYQIASLPKNFRRGAWNPLRAPSPLVAFVAGGSPSDYFARTHECADCDRSSCKQARCMRAQCDQLLQRGIPFDYIGAKRNPHHIARNIAETRINPVKRY